MLRSLNIPTKLVMGYKNDINEYHCWNEVFLKDEGKWITIDTTYDASFDNNNVNYNIEKNNNEYIIEKIY